MAKLHAKPEGYNLAPKGGWKIDNGSDPHWKHSTKHMAEICLISDCLFLFICTELVYGGAEKGPGNIPEIS